MLERLREQVLAFVEEGFGYSRSEVSLFCHYPSSARYSTLHFHIVFGSKYQEWVEKRNRPHTVTRMFFLDTVIENLKADADYYATATLEYYLGDKADLMDPLCAFHSCSPHSFLGGSLRC